MPDGDHGAPSKAAATDALKRLRTSLADVDAVEQALRGQVVLYESVLASLVEGIVVQDISGKIVAFNASATRILGLSDEQLTGRSSLDPSWAAVHADGSPFPGEQHPAMVTLRTGEPLLGVLMGVRVGNGRTRWISINTQPLRDGHSGPIQGVVCSFQDITARRTHEAAIRASEACFQRLEQEREEFFELALDLLCVADLDRGFLKLSRSFELTLGWGPEEMVGRPFLELVHPEDLVPTEDALRQLLERRTTAGFESRYRCKDGSWKSLAWRVSPPAPGSRVLHAVARDVSALRRGADSTVRLAGSLPSADAA
jgi:PAS domain S-box-containing protein